MKVLRVPRSSIHRVVEACLELGVKRAEDYLSPKMVVRGSRRHKPDRRGRTTEIVLTIGAPNYAEREFIARWERDGGRFPVDFIKLTEYK